MKTGLPYETFIVIGHGLTDLFEFQTIIEYNHERISDILMLRLYLREAINSLHNYETD